MPALPGASLCRGVRSRFSVPNTAAHAVTHPVPQTRNRSDLLAGFRIPDGNQSEERAPGPPLKTPHYDVSLPDSRCLVSLCIDGEVHDVFRISTRAIERLRPECHSGQKGIAVA